MSRIPADALFDLLEQERAGPLDLLGWGAALARTALHPGAGRHAADGERRACI